MLFNKEYKQIEAYLLNVGKILKAQTPKSYLKEYHHYLKMVYEQQGNWQKAFEQLSKEYECATAVTSDSAVSVMANSKAQQAVMLEKIQRDKDQKIYETERKSLLTLIISMGLLLVLISVLVFYILRMLNIKRKSNLELCDKNKMLDVQKTELQIHKEIITEQWHEVESVNKKLFSSIRYAQKIQKAALNMPVGRYMHEKDHFQTLSQQLEKGDMVYIIPTASKTSPEENTRPISRRKNSFPGS